MATIEAPVRPELRTASDAEIENAIGHADLMVLRGLLYQLTGDPALKALELKRVKMGRAEMVAPATEADAALVRRKAIEFLKSYRDSGAGRIGYGPEERLPESLGLIVGHDIKAEAVDLMVEETALNPWARSLEWQAEAEPDPARLEQFTVMIIGAGVGGLNAAVQLTRAGIHYHMIEKNPGVGGTWYEDRYPGARVDTPSHSYMNLFGVDFPYPYAFGNHIENQKYYDWVADEFGLRGDITFEVREDTYWRYNKLVDDGNRMNVWADPRAHNYWWTKHGRTASQIPFKGYEVRDFLLHPDFAEMEIG
jgi:4-hydroxyacetophenone monooxygenase